MLSLLNNLLMTFVINKRSIEHSFMYMYHLKAKFNASKSLFQTFSSYYYRVWYQNNAQFLYISKLVLKLVYFVIYKMLSSRNILKCMFFLKCPLSVN